MKTLNSCVNGCGRPPKPPSRVLCAECHDALNSKFVEMISTFAARPVAVDLGSRCPHIRLRYVGRNDGVTCIACGDHWVRERNSGGTQLNLVGKETT